MFSVLRNYSLPILGKGVDLVIFANASHDPAMRATTGIFHSVL